MISLHGSNKKLAIVMIDTIILGGAVPDSDVEKMLEILPTMSSACFETEYLMKVLGQSHRLLLKGSGSGLSRP